MMRLKLHWLNKKYPQNYILRKPYIGTLIYAAFCCGFLLLYKPLNVGPSHYLGFEFTMVAYCCGMSIPIFFAIKGIKKLRYFLKPDEWTLLKELTAIIIILLTNGIAIYFLGFLLEVPEVRWNLRTFIDSCERAFLFGLVPFLFFSFINYQYLFVTDIDRSFWENVDVGSQDKPEELIQISSQLKKEELKFYPSQFVYAESDSNYVVFYLNINNQTQKRMIRNSISNIEQQLSAIPFITRTHRAFIVNIKHVDSQKGNTLGYRLKINGVDTSIPVSRQKTKDFDLLLKQFR